MSIFGDLYSGALKSTINYLAPKSNRTKSVDPAAANVINPVPVIYGRPGWVTASLALVGHEYKRDSDDNRYVSYNTMYTYHVVCEGAAWQPEAVRIKGGVVGYANKYTEAEATAIGGALNNTLIGRTWVYVGGESGCDVEYNLDSTEGRLSSGSWDDSFQQLSVVKCMHFKEKTAQHYGSSVPLTEVLPNGKVLNDPRIPYDYSPGNVAYDNGWYKFEIGGIAAGTLKNGYMEEWGVSRFRPGEWDEPASTATLGAAPDNNPALVFLDYLVDTIYGASIPIADVSMNHIIAAANYADELAPTYNGGPTQQQMACNLELSTEEKLSDNLETILRTCRGLLGWVDGQYQLHIPRANAPVAGSIGSDTILKRRSFSLGQKSKRLNRIIATYIEPNKAYGENQLVYPPADSAEDILWRQTEDKGELNEKEIKLEGCTNAYQAADLSAVLIRESRASITAEYELNLTGLKYTLGDVVRITDPDGAFTDKLFYIRKWQFDFERRVIVIGVREYADTIYDVLQKPVLERPPGTLLGVDPMVIPNVTGVSFAPAIYNKTTLGELSWDIVNHSSVISYDVRAIGPNGDVAWSAGVDATTGDENATRLAVNVPFLTTGTYTLEVRARSSVAVGNYTATTVNHNTPAPEVVTALQLVKPWTGRDAILSWAASTSAAFKRYIVEVRSSAGAVLHSEYVTDPRFDLTFDKNKAAGLKRNHTIAVAVESEAGAVSAFTTLAISNPAPAAPTSIATNAAPNSIALSFDIAATETDFVGPAVEFRKQGGTWARIDLDAHIRNHTFNDLDSSTAYELRLLNRDVFGDGAWSSAVVVTTAGPVAPTTFIAEPGVNMVTLNITAGANYHGVDVWVRPRNSAPGNAVPSWSGADKSVVISELLSGTDYSVYYAPVDAKGVRGAIVHIPFATVKLEAVDLSGLSPWATKLDPIDKAWIADKLAGDAIPSTKIENLTAAKLTAGIINAPIGITSGGSIESANASGYKTGLGVYTAGGETYTFITADASGNIKAGITADGVLKATGADISGKVTIEAGSSGYAGLLDKPTSLADVSAAEADKLSGIAAGADVTDYVAVSGEIDAKVDAVEVGGRNLLKGVSDSWTEISMGTGYYSSFGFDTELVVGETYTFSIFIEKVSADSHPIAVTLGAGNGFEYYKDFIDWREFGITMGERVVLTKTITASDVAQYNLFAFRIRNEQNPTTIRYRSVKLEKGNKATDWTPAPEDVEAFAEEKANAAEQAAKDYADQTFVDVTSYGQDIAQIQTQIDKSITTWFEDGEPTLSNAPASSWASNTDKDVHLGDLYYDNLTGYSYRFKKNGSVYSWGKISDSDVTAALTAAANAQDTADGKRRVFFATPVVPYDKGDLWDTGSGLKRSNVNVATGGTYSASHWVAVADVTDYAAAEATALLKANAAKQQAIDAAALDAQTKANTAEQAAVLAAAMDATDKVNAVEVGGRNLFLDSERVRSSYRFMLIAVADIFAGHEDRVVTISLDLKINQTGVLRNLTIYPYQSNGLTIGDTVYWAPKGLDVWERFSFTTTITQLGNNPGYSAGEIAFYDGVGDNNYSLRRIKIEFGNKATDWTPAPEDVEAFAEEKALAAPKTVIDNGLITTGGIQLDGTTGFIKAGKTAYTDMQTSGFWLGQTTAGGAINIGNNTEYLYFRGDTGLRLKTTDLEIGAGGAATFKGSINTSDGRFKTARSGNTVNGSVADIDTSNSGGLRVNITTPIPASGAVPSGVSILSSGLTGLYSLISNTSSGKDVIYAQTTGSGAGVFGSSSQGAGIHGVTTGSRYSVSSSALKLETSGAPHIRCVVSTAADQYIPYGKRGDIKAIENADGVTNFSHCYESTADNKGKWGNALLAGSFNGGDLASTSLASKVEFGSVWLGGNSNTTVTLPNNILLAVSGTKWKGGDEYDGSSCSWSGTTLSLRNSAGDGQTITYIAITV